MQKFNGHRNVLKEFLISVVKCGDGILNRVSTDRIGVKNAKQNGDMPSNTLNTYCDKPSIGSGGGIDENRTSQQNKWSENGGGQIKDNPKYCEENCSI